MMNERSARAVVIPAGPVELPGDLTMAENARGLVIFVHGSGSSRLSPRNQAVAGRLNEAGLSTLLFDLLTAGEEEERSLVFDIAELSRRLVAVTGWLRAQPETGELPVGYFGASTGAAAALVAAAELGQQIGAVVSRGGRPDLAGHSLSRVTAPTLLIVGGRDIHVLRLNEQAAQRMTCPHRIEVIPGATHLFSEPGALETVAELASEWFVRHLRRTASVVVTGSRQSFADRTDAGRALADALRQFADRPDIVVLGLARGGVPVAAEVARALHAPLDVFVARKVALPGNREFAVGAVAGNGVKMIDNASVRRLRVSPEVVNEAVSRAQAELRQRESTLREGRAPIDLRDKTVLLVDDGLATGSTMKAAVEAIRASHPREVVVAVPVASRSALQALSEVADSVISLAAPPGFRAVGQWYGDFSQTTDAEVRESLSHA